MLVSGVVCVVLGVLLAIFHKRYSHFLRRTSDRLFSEALAEATMNPGENPKMILVVGVVAVVMGLVQIGFGLGLI